MPRAGLEARTNGGRHRCTLHVSVLATKSVIAYAQHVPNDAEAVTERMDLGAIIMSPGHGDFSHLEVETSGQKEDLGVKAPPVHFLRWKNSARGLTGESLESALGIFLRKREDAAQEQVKSPTSDLTIKRLANSLSVTIFPARANGDIGAGGNSGKKLLRLSN